MENLARVALRGIALAAALTAAAAPVRADDNVVFADTGATAVHDCGQGGKVAINGARNDIRLTGTCARVIVGGTGNTVTAVTVTALAVTGAANTIAVDAAAKVALGGTRNRVTWRSGKRPRVSATGIENTVARAP